MASSATTRTAFARRSDADAAGHASAAHRERRRFLARNGRHGRVRRVRALVAARTRIALRSLAARYLLVPARQRRAHLLQHAGAVHVWLRGGAALRLALLCRVLLRLRGE